MLFASGRLYSFDEVILLETTAGLVERGDLSIEYTPERRLYSKPGHDGRLYSKFGLGMSAALVPFYTAARIVSTGIGASDPAAAAEILTCFSNAIIVASLCVLMLDTLLLLGMHSRASLVTAALLAFSTSMAVYGRGLFNDALTGFLLLSAFRSWWTDRPALCGACVGALFATRAEYALVAPVFFFAWRLKRIPLYALPCASIAALVALFNHARFGSSTDQGTLTEDPYDVFSTPIPLGLAGILFSSGKGLLWYAPPAVLSILGARAFYTRRRTASILILAALIPPLILHAHWHSWMGGWSYGPRRMIALLPLLLIPAADAVERLMKSRGGRGALGTLALIGFLAQLPGLTTDFMKYIRIVSAPGRSVLWDPLYSPIPGQIMMLWKTGEWDLWYVHLFGKSPAAVTVAIMLALAISVAALRTWRLTRTNSTC